MRLYSAINEAFFCFTAGRVMIVHMQTTQWFITLTTGF